MKIAFAGYGIEAESAYRYYKNRFPDAEFAVYDSQATAKRPLPEGVVFYGDVKEFRNIDADVVVRTPSIAPSKITTTGTVSSVTTEFFAQCRLPIIGVTGTKGKGTTATLIAKILENAGIKTWLVGNIGIPALDLIDEINGATEGVIVYELSSFQLWDLQQSPHVGVVLTIEPEHLDIHETFANYVAAKANITTHQNPDDIVVYFEPNNSSRSIAEQSLGNKIGYSGMIIKDGKIMLDDEPLMDASEIGLKGSHNLQNIAAAIAATRSFTSDRAAIASALQGFKGLPHRLEEIGKRDGVLYVNDNFSSAPPAVLAAVRSYTAPLTVIMGGYDRGLDLGPLVEELVGEQQLKRVELIGQTAPRLKELFISYGYDQVYLNASLEEAFASARAHAVSGDAVIMSPGCASFDMFKDFTARGDAFRSLVAGLPRKFIFDNYSYDPVLREAKFRYSFDEYDFFEERIIFSDSTEYDASMLDKVLQLASFVIGTSYAKLYPGSLVEIRNSSIDDWQADFMNAVYQEGMSQYAYENGLTRNDLVHFKPSVKVSEAAHPYSGRGILALQSGGKDSLLTASMLDQNNHQFDSLYIASTGGYYPQFIEQLPGRLHVTRRLIDLAALKSHVHSGALSGHVPVTFIVLALSLVQTVLLNKNTVVVSIGHEGEEAHEWIGDLAVTHQWSKTWHAEQLIADYVRLYVSEDLHVGSPLRRFTELKIAELFVNTSWERYGHEFSSCNVANYKQGNDNSKLTWCGECPKCANSYLLFAPFLPAAELQSLFGGKDLFTKPNLIHTFEGLLGINDVMKPFECVGEIDELRYAYHRAQQQGGYAKLPFDVPESHFDYEQQYPSQAWATSLFSI